MIGASTDWELNETDRLRDSFRRLFEIASQTNNSQEAVQALRAMANVAGQLAEKLRGGQDEFTQTLVQGLDDMARELGEQNS